MEYLAEDTAPEAVAARLLRKASTPAPKAGKTTDVEKTLLTGRYLNQDREEPVKYEPLPAIDRGDMATPVLQKKLNDILTTQPDFKAEAEANRSRRAGARQDVGAGLMMAIHGNDRIARAGGQVLTHALEGAKPLRMNAADIAYEGADGEMVGSSAAQRAQQIKVLENQIAEQDKVDTARIAAEAKRRDNELAARRAEDAARLGAQKLAPTIVIANAAADRAANVGAGKEDGLTNKQRDTIAGHNAEIATVDGALKAAAAAPSAFSFARGSAQLAGSPGESIAGRYDTPEERHARTRIFNQVASLIKERAGTAVSAAEQTRIDSYMPSKYDTYEEIVDKLDGYKKYLAEKRDAMNVVVPKHPGTERRKPENAKERALLDKYPEVK